MQYSPAQVTKIIIATLAGTTLVSTGLAVYFYGQAQTASLSTGDAAQSEVRTLTAKVGRLMAIPQDEEPTIATVADPDRLKSRPFFANVSKGDKVLLYSKAKKAILYNPGADKVVEVAPLAEGAEATVVSPDKK